MSFLAVVAAAFVAEPIFTASEVSQDLEVPEYRPPVATTESSLGGPVTSAFHLWDIQEIYSNADGSVQFVELFCSSNNQQFLSGHTLRLEQISPLSTLNTFNFANSGTPTTNATLLIGTSNLGTLYGVTPDQVMPANFLSTSGTNKRVNFAEGQDIVNIDSLPFDGVQSLNGVIGGTSPNNLPTTFSINSQATPRNFAGVTATIPEPGAGALLLAGLLMSARRQQFPSSPRAEKAKQRGLRGAGGAQ